MDSYFIDRLASQVKSGRKDKRFLIDAMKCFIKSERHLELIPFISSLLPAEQFSDMGFWDGDYYFENPVRTAVMHCSSVDVFAVDSSEDSDVEEVNARSCHTTSLKEEAKRPRITGNTQDVCNSPQTGVLEKEGTFIHEENYKKSQKQMVSLFHLRPEASRKQAMRINDIKKIPGIEKR